MSKQLLIIGAGMATAYLLQSLEQYAAELDITVIGDEVDSCYNRVMLSEVLAGEKTEDALQMLSADSARCARFITGTRVTAVDLEGRRVHCDQGQSLQFDLLVFATGSSVAVPPQVDTGLTGVKDFRTLADTRWLQGTEGNGKHAVVLGGGLLGLEAAHGLNQHGYQTTVVHRNRWPMNRQLDETGGDHLRQALQHQGIGFELSASLASVSGNAGAVKAITLDNGKQLDCDLLLLATGIVPNHSLAQAAGIQTDRGILVNPRLGTSVPGVYALGECCQLGQNCFGLVAPIRQQAKVLAAELMEQPTGEFQIEDWPTQLKISGVDIYRAGELDPQAEQLLLVDDQRGIYRRLLVRDDQLIGAVLVGDKRGGTWYAELIKNRRNIAGMRQGLMFGPDIAQSLLSAAAA